MINDISRPLILLGSNSNIFKIYELCISIGYTIAGIIDEDYYGQGEFNGISVIGTEQDLIDNTAKYKEQYQFICITNSIPADDPAYTRNRFKRTRQLELLDKLVLPVATIISPQAQISVHSVIGKGVIIDAFSVIEPNVTICDYVTIYATSYVGHHSIVGRNTVIQRHCFITSAVIIENNVYFGLCSKICRSNVIIGSNTFIHPGLMLLRSTAINEEISLAGKDLRKIYHDVIIN